MVAASDEKQIDRVLLSSLLGEVGFSGNNRGSAENLETFRFPYFVPLRRAAPSLRKCRVFNTSPTYSFRSASSRIFRRVRACGEVICNAMIQVRETHRARWRKKAASDRHRKGIPSRTRSRSIDRVRRDERLKGQRGLKRVPCTASEEPEPRR